VTASRSEALALLLALCAGAGCSTAGRLELGNGRGAYNAVINRTEDEQILSMIVRQRYDETYGLLAVASVTASLKVGGSLGANVGIGSDSSYAGNLVPFAAGATYEESPTISYVPVRGEQFTLRLLAPLSGEHTLLLERMSSPELEPLRLLVRRANGLVNPVYAPGPPGTDFDRFIEHYVRLRDQGVLDTVSSGEGSYELLLHDYTAAQAAEVNELLRLLGIARAADPPRDVKLPLRFFVGSARGGGVDLETPSALEVIEAAGLGVEVPAPHLAEGIARASALDASHRFLAIHASGSRPSEAAVAVEHRGWWFYIDARDARSKQSFQLLRTLIGLRLDEAGAQGAPLLTVPVGD
jgi:hypothetical protein